MRALTALPKRLALALQARIPDRGDQLLVVAVLTVVMLAVGGTVAVVRSTPTGAAEQAFDVPSMASGPAATDTSSTTTSPTTTTTGPPAAPAAAPLPASAHKVNLGGDVHPMVPAKPIGRIEIPKINLDHPIFEGVDETVIHWGPGHWPGSAMPGQVGNSVFAGHRVTHTHPFRNLDQLVPGDEIQFVMPDGTYTYRMTQQQIVDPNDTWIVNPTPTATLTLFACHPPGSATHRIVIRADYVGKS